MTKTKHNFLKTSVIHVESNHIIIINYTSCIMYVPEKNKGEEEFCI